MNWWSRVLEKRLPVCRANWRIWTRGGKPSWRRRSRESSSWNRLCFRLLIYFYRNLTLVGLNKDHRTSFFFFLVAVSFFIREAFFDIFFWPQQQTQTALTTEGRERDLHASSGCINNAWSFKTWNFSVWIEKNLSDEMRNIFRKIKFNCLYSNPQGLPWYTQDDRKISPSNCNLKPLHNLLFSIKYGSFFYPKGINMICQNL